jgi:hypothetical protein
VVAFRWVLKKGEKMVVPAEFLPKPGDEAAALEKRRYELMSLFDFVDVHHAGYLDHRQLHLLLTIIGAGPPWPVIADADPL